MSAESVNVINRAEREAGRHFINNTGDRAWRAWMRDLLFTANKYAADLEELRERARLVCEGASEIMEIAGSGYTVPGILLMELDALLPPRTPDPHSAKQDGK